MEILDSILNNRLLNKHGTKIYTVIALLILLFVVVSSTIQWRTQQQTKQDNYKPQTITSTQNRTQKYNIRDITTANLFGNPNEVKVIKQAPKTTLDLTLQGILYTRNSNIARAIIMAGRKKSGLYSVGEKIKGTEVTIKEIRDNEVLLNRNGVIESLPLIKKTSSGDRQIITFNDSNASDINNSHSQNVNYDELRIEQATKRAPPPPPGINNRRKIKKPNFSGLDKALEKLGEL